MHYDIFLNQKGLNIKLWDDQNCLCKNHSHTLHGRTNYYYNYDEDSNWEGEWKWGNNIVYNFAGSVRVCRLSSRSQLKPLRLSEGDIGGYGVEISIRHLRQETKFSTPVESSYWTLGKNDLFREFRSTSFTITPGLQVVGPGSKAGLFIGIIGVGYARNHVRECFWETIIEIAKKEGEDVSGISIETKVTPIVFTILPIKIERLLYKDIAIGIDFSGLLCYPGKTDWKFTDPELGFPSESFWLTNIQIGLTLSLCLH